MLTQIQEQLFSHPEDETQVVSAWHGFLRGGEAPGLLRELIGQSWRRSQSAGVDIGRDHAPLAVKPDRLEQLRNSWQELVDASAPIMESTRTLLADTGMVMVLTDPQGVILSTEGDRSVFGQAENLRLVPGANWNETACGTNAIGTAIELGLPVQIHSCEHYCERIKRWTCSAMVVRDPLDRRILGVLDISGLKSSYSRHTLNLAISTAARIEHRLARKEIELRCRLLESCLQHGENAGSDGVILFDRHGRFVRANGRAAEMLDALQRRHGAAMQPLNRLRLEGDDHPGNLPDWIEQERLAPVHADGQRIGTMLILASPRRPTPTAPAAEKTSFPGVIGRSQAIVEAVARARQLARSRVPVLLKGESGVGKELFARGIHDAGGRDGDAPFVALNCGGLSRELIGSELFGHVEGAFTGARRGGMAGKIEAANGGTLFLDEIGELPLELQPHFLRVLELGEIYRIGEARPRKVDFRLVAASHRDLRREVQEGRFRMDLYYRIAVTCVEIPPLRERGDDIDLLVDHYLDTLARRHDLPGRMLGPPLRQLLRAYAWPGNVRELRNAIESMLLTARGPLLTEADLPAEIAAIGATVQAPALSLLGQAERQALCEALLQCEGNMTHAARRLGIAKSTLYTKIKRCGLESLVDELRGQRG